jgi:hypothetical protein
MSGLGYSRVASQEIGLLSSGPTKLNYFSYTHVTDGNGCVSVPYSLTAYL